MEMEQSQLLAELRQRAAGTYERVKGCEADAGGRLLPGGLKNAVCQISRMKIGKSEKGGLYAFIYSSAVEPKEIAKIFVGFMFSLDEDQFNSREDNWQKFIGALKLLGYAHLVERCSEDQFYSQVLPQIIDDIGTKKPFALFNTSTRPNNNGEYRASIQGLVSGNYAMPQAPMQQPQHTGYMPLQGPTTPQAGPPLPGNQPIPQMQGPPLPQMQSPPLPQMQAPPLPQSTPIPQSPPIPQQAPPPPIPQKTAPVAVGQAAMTTGDLYRTGQVYRGIIHEINMDTETAMLNIAGNIYPVPFANIAPDDNGGQPAPTRMIVVGSQVRTEPTYFGDGKSYPGVVAAITGTTATVDFGGQTAPIPLDKLQLV